jgi:hypothetical protein
MALQLFEQNLAHPRFTSALFAVNLARQRLF